MARLAEGFARDESIRVVRATLADGRDLLYFDDADSSLPPERAPDVRDLESRPHTATMRLDPLTGDWISIASVRQGRVFLPPADQDPLAPQSPGNPSEIPALYDVAVFENRSPSFGPLATQEAPPVEGVALDASAPSAGRCEVVCFAPEHDGSLADLPVSRVRTIVEAWAHRTEELSALPAVKQVFPFENRGEAIGVTLHHPHGQIYAYPYVTPRTEALQRSVAQYGPSLFADILDSERNSSRVLATGEHWTAFVPYAARWPIEIHLLPHRDLPDLARTSLPERDELASIYLRLLRALAVRYADPTPYIAAWHQAPLTGGEGIRAMLQITSPRRSEDKLKFLAGSEAAMGAWVADVVPEDSAAALRDAMARSEESTAR